MCLRSGRRTVVGDNLLRQERRSPGRSRQLPGCPDHAPGPVPPPGRASLPSERRACRRRRPATGGRARLEPRRENLNARPAAARPAGQRPRSPLPVSRASTRPRRSAICWTASASARSSASTRAAVPPAGAVASGPSRSSASAAGRGGRRRRPCRGGRPPTRPASAGPWPSARSGSTPRTPASTRPASAARHPAAARPEWMRSRRVSAMTSNVSGTPLPAGLRPRRVVITPATPAFHALYQQYPARPNRETGPTLPASHHPQERNQEGCT